MRHIGSDPANPGWTRSYTYTEPSLLEPGKQSNRLTSTTIDGTTETYSTAGDGYDAHGNMTAMPHLKPMQWDFKDQLQMTQRQVVNDADADGVQHQGERTWYVYDSAGQRVRKVTESASGEIKDERIYLGGFEIYRRHGANPLVRETLHIMDDKQRIALVETRTQGNEPSVPQRLIRYQFGNHLGSASLELDDQAQIISYEEYTPYGSTSYQAVRSQTETPKRYRYTGKERDEESGFYYHVVRYYVPWLAKWLSCDPAGLVYGPNSFRYARNNPIGFLDPDGTNPVLPEEEVAQASIPELHNACREENYIAPYKDQEKLLYKNEELIKEHPVPGAIHKAEGLNPVTGKSDFTKKNYRESATFLNPTDRADIKTYSSTTDMSGQVRMSDHELIRDYKARQQMCYEGNGTSIPPEEIMADRIEHMVNTGTPRDVATEAVIIQRMGVDGTLTTQQAAEKLQAFEEATKGVTTSPAKTTVASAANGEAHALESAAVESGGLLKTMGKGALVLVGLGIFFAAKDAETAEARGDTTGATLSWATAVPIPGFSELAIGAKSIWDPSYVISKHINSCMGVPLADALGELIPGDPRRFACSNFYPANQQPSLQDLGF